MKKLEELMESIFADEPAETKDLDKDVDSGADADKLAEDELAAIEAEADALLESLNSEEKSEEELEEATRVKMDKKAMLKNNTVKAAMSMARSSKDPLYNKYKKGEALRKAAITAIVKKYKGKAVAQARAAMSKKK